MNEARFEAAIEAARPIHRRACLPKERLWDLALIIQRQEEPPRRDKAHLEACPLCRDDLACAQAIQAPGPFEVLLRWGRDGALRLLDCLDSPGRGLVLEGLARRERHAPEVAPETAVLRSSQNGLDCRLEVAPGMRGHDLRCRVERQGQAVPHAVALENAAGQLVEKRPSMDGESQLRGVEGSEALVLIEAEGHVFEFRLTWDAEIS